MAPLLRRNPLKGGLLKVNIKTNDYFRRINEGRINKLRASVRIKAAKVRHFSLHRLLFLAIPLLTFTLLIEVPALFHLPALICILF